MSKVVFQIAKFNDLSNSDETKIDRLLCRQYYSANRDKVMAGATLYLEYGFVAGMIHGFVNDDEEVTFFWDREEENNDVLNDYNVDFSDAQIESIKSQILAIGSKLTNPPIDDNGVSTLRGYQLQVEFFPNEEASMKQEEFLNKKTGKTTQKIIFKFKPYQVKSVTIVTPSSPEYLEDPDTVKVNINMAMKSMYKSKPKTESVPKPTTVAETKALLFDFKSPKAKQRQAKGIAKEQARVAAAAAAVESKPQQILLVEDDEDDEKPE